MTKIKTAKILTLTLVVVTFGIMGSFSFSNAAEDEVVPKWIQNVASFWSNGDVSDQEFVNAMEFLVEEGIMNLPNSVSTAEAQTITSSLEEMSERLEAVEAQTSSATGTTVAPPTIPDQPPEDTTYPYVFAVCPADKVRHFDKVWFTTSGYHLPGIGGGDAVTQISENVIIFEESEKEIKYPFDMRLRVTDRLNELGYDNGEVNSSQITIVDIEHAVICANKPGISNSGTVSGYK